MTTHTHQTAPTQFVDAGGLRYAYRRFGKAGTIPLVLNMHFTGTMDHWDPAVTDGLANSREVILFNNAGISSTNGEVPTTVAQMGKNASNFIKGLGLKKVDVLGFSLGGMVAQEITLQNPDLVRRLILVGTGPRGGEGMESLTPEAQAIFGKTRAVADELWLDVFFTPTAESQKAGRSYLERMNTRKVNRDPLAADTVAGAQLAAIQEWGTPRDKPYDYLKNIKQPTLVINGGTDVIVYTVNSYFLQQNLPDAQLILYPDANHGSQYQYPERFVKHVDSFLDD